MLLLPHLGSYYLNLGSWNERPTRSVPTSKSDGRDRTCEPETAAGGQIKKKQKKAYEGDGLKVVGPTQRVENIIAKKIEGIKPTRENKKTKTKQNNRIKEKTQNGGGGGQ